MLGIIKKYPISSYFIFTYLLSWSMILIIVYPKLIISMPLEFGDIGLMFLSMLFGPSFIGLILTGVLYGKAGIKSLISRMLKVKNNCLWYLIAILTTPTILIMVLFFLSYFVSSSFLPSFQIIGLVLGFAAGFFEEVGWTGFALPELQKKFTPLKSGLVLGLTWGIWHILADYLGASAALGSAWLPTFFFRYIMAVTAYRVIMVWVYNKTKSLFISQIMHGSFSAALFCFGPITSYENGVVWNGVFAVAICLIVAFILLVKQTGLDRQILSDRVDSVPSPFVK